MWKIDSQDPSRLDKFLDGGGALSTFNLKKIRCS